MLVHLAPSSGTIFALLIGCFVLVLLFEASNGFHDTSNAVATVIYTNALPAVPAVILSGIMNFVGVLAGGIAVAYALVEILPPDVLTPPDGAPAVPMLVAIFASALFWNVATWAMGIPNSSSHCIVGALVGVAVGDAFIRAKPLGHGVDWRQITTVLEALAISPILGFVLAGGVYWLLRRTVRTGSLFEPPKEGQPPVWWLRGLLVLTCSGVSFAHGTNDGQKSIGLIMLTVIGLMPVTYALNPNVPREMAQLARNAALAEPLVGRYGGEDSADAVAAAKSLELSTPRPTDAAADTDPARRAARSQVRGDIYTVLGALRHATERNNIPQADRAEARRLVAEMSPPVQYAPLWVRMLSALCLGAGTMVGYKRIVRTLGERLGKGRMTPGQGASTEVVGALLIGTAGFTGLPVSTTHIITSGVAGTMVAGGEGVQRAMLVRIGLAWLLTLPVTVTLSAALFYVLDNPTL